MPATEEPNPAAPLRRSGRGNAGAYMPGLLDKEKGEQEGEGECTTCVASQCMHLSVLYLSNVPATLCHADKKQKLEERAAAAIERDDISSLCRVDGEMKAAGLHTGKVGQQVYAKISGRKATGKPKVASINGLAVRRK